MEYCTCSDVCKTCGLKKYKTINPVFLTGKAKKMYSELKGNWSSNIEVMLDGSNKVTLYAYDFFEMADYDEPREWAKLKRMGGKYSDEYPNASFEFPFKGNVKESAKLR